MADVNLMLPAFGVVWAQDGTIAVIDEAQWRAGWAFIGATPPSVEQFNKVMQVQDQKANWLYRQMLSVMTQAGETPTVGDDNSLRDALASIFNLGRLVNVQVLSASGTYTRTAGATRGRLRMVGGGAGGSGSVTAAAGSVSAGRGGGSGAYLEHWFSALPASQGYTIGAGGSGGTTGGGAGGAGGATVFGTLTAPGAPATATGNAYVPPALESGGLGALVATGGNLVNASGSAAPAAQALTTSSIIGGGGAPSAFGGGGNPLISSTATGNPSPSRGGGGSGGSNGASTAGQAGGAGGAGLIIIEEYS